MGKKILLFIKKIFLKIGIDIKFVRKESDLSAIEHNTEDAFDELFSDDKKIKSYHEKERLLFYSKIISFCEKLNVGFNNKIIADVGCGTGKLISYIFEKYKPSKIYGFDFSEKAIAYAKKIAVNAEFKHHDLYNKLNVTFDIIFCTEVLEHLLYPEKALKNLILAMSEKSTIIITVPNGRLDTFAGHINFWSPESWEVFINQNSEGLYCKAENLDEKNLIAIIRKG